MLLFLTSYSLATCYKFCFNCCYRYMSLPTRVIEPSTHCAFTYSKSIVKMSSKPQQKPFKIGSSPPEVFYNKEILKNFVKFIGKHLRWSLLFHKVTSSEAVTWRCSVKKACNLFKKETMAQVFFCEYCKIFKNTFYRTPVATFADWNHTTVLKKDSSTCVF